MRTVGEPDQRAAFNAALAELGVDESASISDQRAGEQGDEYEVTFRGQRRMLDRHLRKGNSKDEAYSLRIYYFWDDTAQEVVIGWLPSHLRNRLT